MPVLDKSPIHGQMELFIIWVQYFIHFSEQKKKKKKKKKYSWIKPIWQYLLTVV